MLARGVAALADSLSRYLCAVDIGAGPWTSIFIRYSGAAALSMLAKGLSLIEELAVFAASIGELIAGAPVVCGDLRRNGDKVLPSIGEAGLDLDLPLGASGSITPPRLGAGVPDLLPLRALDVDRDRFICLLETFSLVVDTAGPGSSSSLSDKATPPGALPKSTADPVSDT